MKHSAAEKSQKEHAGNVLGDVSKEDLKLGAGLRPPLCGWGEKPQSGVEPAGWETRGKRLHFSAPYLIL